MIRWVPIRFLSVACFCPSEDTQVQRNQTNSALRHRSSFEQLKESEKKRSVEMDMSEFKTPILTENNLGVLDKDVCEIIVPEKTIVTPGARSILKNRALSIVYK